MSFELSGSGVHDLQDVSSDLIHGKSPWVTFLSAETLEHAVCVITKAPNSEK